jgi:cytoskeletal protein CcmA (bactofilin family)
VTYQVSYLRLLPVCLLLCLAFASTASARESHDRTQVGGNITVGPGEEVSDATCFGCSIRVRGHVSSDVTAFGGSIIVEDQGQVDGDVTAFAGSIRLGNQGSVKGDVTVFGGRIQRDPTTTISGDITTMGGPGWIVLILGAPFFFFALFVALVVWVVRRLLRPAVPVTAQRVAAR